MKENLSTEPSNEDVISKFGKIGIFTIYYIKTIFL